MHEHVIAAVRGGRGFAEWADFDRGSVMADFDRWPMMADFDRWPMMADFDRWPMMADFDRWPMMADFACGSIRPTVLSECFFLT